MYTILISAYAVNPFKGSEDAMGWNLLLEAARYNRIIAVTRKNNRSSIEQYQLAHPELEARFNNLQFLYFDWPAWMLFWKKGPLLSMIYFYCWQFCGAIWVACTQDLRKLDAVHNLNFHNDWTPSFLWLLRKPFIWGHVGHHPKIPRQYLLPVYGWPAFLQDRFLWLVKQIAWQLDPFLYITRRRASKIICMNRDAVRQLRLQHNFLLHPSVAAESPLVDAGIQKNRFMVLSVGRFVPLKGFDLVIRSFAQFYRKLPPPEQAQASLVLVGKGPCLKKLKAIAVEENIVQAVLFREWMPRQELVSYYQAASIFLFPSHEGAGMVVPEAMSYALPVICLKNEGPGYLCHPDSQLKIPYGNYSHTVGLLADKLTLLFRSPAEYEREAALSFARFDTLFRWEVRGEMLREVYAGAINKLSDKINYETEPGSCSFVK